MSLTLDSTRRLNAEEAGIPTLWADSASRWFAISRSCCAPGDRDTVKLVVGDYVPLQVEVQDGRRILRVI